MMYYYNLRLLVCREELHRVRSMMGVPCGFWVIDRTGGGGVGRGQRGRFFACG